LTSETGAAPRGIIFDLDGTLIDSRRDIAAAVNRMRGERELPPLTVEQVDAMVGEGARVLVRRALSPQPGPAAGPGRDELRQALASYLAHYADVCLDTTCAYPGVAAMLAALAPSFTLGVLTNKGEALSRRILDSLGLGRHLREVVGGDTLPTRKPNPGGLFLLADRLGTAADRLLLVGDSDIDARTALAAGCPFALALWGRTAASRETATPATTAAAAAAPAGPRWVLARPGDLPAAVGLPEDAADANGAAGNAAG
jgi:phosphoglycolate phosphatase